jgi:hypothetical protein
VAPGPPRGSCAEFNLAMARAVQRLHPRVVILNSYWSRTDPLRPPGTFSGTTATASLAAGLEQTRRELAAAGASVCVVLDPPTLKYAAPYALAVARRRGIDNGFLRVKRADVLRQYLPAEEQIRSLQRRGPLQIVDPKETLCREPVCEVERDGKALYTDKDHLSVEGATAVAGSLERCFDGSASALDHHD